MSRDRLPFLRALAWRSVRMIADGEKGADALERFEADAFDALEVVDRRKGAVLFAVLDDAVGERVADPFQLTELDPRCRVDFEAKVVVAGLEAVDFDRDCSPVGQANPINDRKDR